MLTCEPEVLAPPRDLRHIATRICAVRGADQKGQPRPCILINLVRAIASMSGSRLAPNHQVTTNHPSRARLVRLSRWSGCLPGQGAKAFGGDAGYEAPFLGVAHQPGGPGGEAAVTEFGFAVVGLFLESSLIMTTQSVQEFVRRPVAMLRYIVNYHVGTREGHT